MRRGASILAVLALLWGGYWFAGTQALQRIADTTVASEIAANRLAAGAAATVGGFPARFQLRLDGFDWRPPDSAARWSAEQIELSAAAWSPWRIMADLTGALGYRNGAEQFTLSGHSLSAEFAVAPAPRLPLSEVGLRGTLVTLGSSLGWTLDAQEVVAALLAEPAREPERGAAVEGRYALSARISGLAPDPALRAQLGPAAAGSADISLRAGLRLTAPLDRLSASAPPVLTAIELRALRADWGPVMIEASGEVVAAASGLAEGRIAIRIHKWQQILPSLQAAGVLSAEFAPTAMRMLEALAANSGDPGVLELPLTFAGGVMSLGPFPLGPAPVLRVAGGAAPSGQGALTPGIFMNR